jgi:hypothetical protein
MARMIPPEIYSACPSPGEHEVFRRLRDDPTTADWIVLHSLDVAIHQRQVAGEIDFVAIIPGMGVICVEVKAHSHIRCEQGRWYYGSNSTPELRSPFRQASEGMHSIRNFVAQHRPDLRSVPFWSAVVFPYVVWNGKSAEWHPWQVIDSHAFMSHPIGELLRTVLHEARILLASRPDAKWFRVESNAPDMRQCEAIAQVLRPNFEHFELPKQRVARLGEEVKRYTQEQYVALDAMERNPRVVFAGPAGTGKTILAIEAARKSSSVGKRVLMLCFNRLLGKWLEDQVANLRPAVTCRTLHRQMLAVCGRTLPDDGADKRYWETELPSKAIENLLSAQASEYIYDELVIDEAPDILRNEFLDFLDLSLRGGLASGRWRMFGDFEKQAIYGSANLSLDEVLANRIGPVPVFSLRVNCRSTPRIAEFVHLLGGLTPRYSRVLRPDTGIEPGLHPHTNGGGQLVALANVLQGMYEAGFSGNDIAVLSPRNDASCAAAFCGSPWKERLRPFSAARRENVGYGSIWAYKGLEAPAVVITDCSRLTGSEATSLFYIGITRALHRLEILVDDNLRDEMLRLLSGSAS